MICPYCELETEPFLRYHEGESDCVQAMKDARTLAAQSRRATLRKLVLCLVVSLAASCVMAPAPRANPLCLCKRCDCGIGECGCAGAREEARQ